MRRLLVVTPLMLLAACGGMDTAPATPTPIPASCEEQVYSDPLVKDLLMKSAGSDTYRLSHIDQLKYAKLDAAHRCLQRQGLAPPGGGVQRPTVTN